MDDAPGLILKANIDLLGIQQNINELTAEVDKFYTKAEKQAARADAALTRSADNLLNMLNPVRRAQQDYDEELALAKRLLDAGKISQENYTDAVRRSSAVLDAAKRAQAGNGQALSISAGQQQNAIKNLGFQFNDFLTQVQGGTPILRAFVSQSGQAAGALADMGGKAGIVGRFFSGVLGGGILAVGTIAAQFALDMWSASRATDAVGKSSKAALSPIEALNKLLEEDPAVEAAKSASDLAKARDKQADATFRAADAEIALRVSAAQSRVADLSDGIVSGSSRAGGRKLDTRVTRAGSELFREQRQAEIDLQAAERDRATQARRFQAWNKARTASEAAAAKGGGRSTVSRASRSTPSLAGTPEDYGFKQRSFAELMRDADIEGFAGIKSQSEAFGKSIKGAYDGLVELGEVAPDALEPVRDAFTDIQERGIDGLTDGITDAIMGTRSLGSAFKSVANQIIADLIRIEVQKSITGPLAAALGDAGGLSGLFSSAFGGGSAASGGTSVSADAGLASMGFYADGGRPPVGMPSVVGERGPEIFIPDIAGTVIPNHRLNMGGGSQSIAIRVDARGANDPAMVEAAAYRAVYASTPMLLAAAQGRTISAASRPSLPGSMG